MHRRILVLGALVALIFAGLVTTSAAAQEVVPSCEGVELEFCGSEDVEEVAAECRWREEVEGYPGEVESEGRIIPAVAICWEVVAALRERERPRREREARRRREWAQKPSVTSRLAEAETLRLLGGLSGWRHRRLGTVDCGGGRVNRTQWGCAVAWIRRGTCNVGRVRVYGAGHRDGQAFFGAHARWRRGYGWIEDGEVNCHFGYD